MFRGEGGVVVWEWEELFYFEGRGRGREGWGLYRAMKILVLCL